MSYEMNQWYGCFGPCRPCNMPPRDVFYTGPCPPAPKPCDHDWGDIMFAHCIHTGNLTAEAGVPIPLDGMCYGVSGAFRHCDCGIQFACKGTYLICIVINVPDFPVPIAPSAVNPVRLNLLLNGAEIPGGAVTIDTGNPSGSYVIKTVAYIPADSVLTLESNAAINLTQNPNGDAIFSITLLKLG